MTRGLVRETRVTYGERKARRVEVSNSRHVVAFLDRAIPDLRDQLEESFVVMGLDAKNRIVAWSEVGRGSLTGVNVDVAAVFRWALLSGVVSIVVAHNHPSGDPYPSPEDVAITRRLVEAGEILGISVLDHIVLGEGSSASFLDLGFMAVKK